MEASHDFLFKIVIVGNSTVGKSCLLLQFCDGMYSSSHIVTLGVDFKIRQFDLDSQRIKLQLWDTAGQDRFESITNSYYRGADGMFIVYDVTNRASFDRVRKWVADVRYYANRDPICLLIGNKSDLTDKRVVTEQEGAELAEELGIPFIETSAKTSANVDAAFFKLARSLTERHQRRRLVNARNEDQAASRGRVLTWKDSQSEPVTGPSSWLSWCSIL